MPTKGEMQVSFLYQDDAFEMKDSKGGSPITLYKTLFLTQDKKLITYYLREKITLAYTLPDVKLITDFKPNVKGKLEMQVVEVQY